MTDNLQFDWTIPTLTQEPEWGQQAYVLDKLKASSFFSVFSLISPKLLSSLDFLSSWLAQEKTSTPQVFIENSSKKWDTDTEKLLEFFTSTPYLNALSLHLEKNKIDNAPALYIHYVFFALLKAQDNFDRQQFEKDYPIDTLERTYQLFATARLFDTRSQLVEPEVRHFGDLLSSRLSPQYIEETITRVRSFFIKPHQTLFLKDFGFSLFKINELSVLSAEEKELGFIHALEKNRETFRPKDIEAAFDIEFIFNKTTLKKYLSVAIQENSYLLFNTKEITEFKNKYQSLLSLIELQDLKDIVGWDKPGLNFESFEKLKKILPQFFLLSNPAWRLELEQNPKLIDEKITKQLIKKDPVWLQEIVYKCAHDYPDIALYLTAEYVAQHIKNIQVIEALYESFSLETLENKNFPSELFTEKLVLRYIKDHPFLEPHLLPEPVQNYLKENDNILKAISNNHEVYRLLSSQTQALPQVYFCYLKALGDYRTSISSERYIFPDFTASILNQPTEAAHVFNLADPIRQNLLKLVPENVWSHTSFITALSQALDSDKNLIYKLKPVLPFKIKEYIEAHSLAIKNIGSYAQFFDIEIQKQYLQASLNQTTQNSTKKHKI